MQKKDSWLLPDGIDEVLPAQAEFLEALRRKLLDTFSVWGYQQVIPPFVDFLDSLLTGSGHDLDLQTFKLTDPLTGQMLGVRADMTPQVARIDSHNLHHEWPTRLCYAGTTLNAIGDGLEKTRSPMQIGAELYGHQGIESDYEVIRLMLETLAMSGLLNIHLDLGHVTIYRRLSELANLEPSQESELFNLMQRKACPELNEFIHDLAMDATYKNLLLQLPKLNGSREVLKKAAQLFQGIDEQITLALSDLNRISQLLEQDYPDLPVSFDLAELRGYHYHTGMVFASFIPTFGREIARGGRYDNIGKVFGRARPATGFSSDLKILVQQYQLSCSESVKQVVFAPSIQDPDLRSFIADLRLNGTVVIEHLPTQQGSALEMGCTATLEKIDHQWVLTPLAKA